MTQKVCRRCNTEQPLEQFNRRSSARDGRDSWCKGCTRAACRENDRKRRKGELPTEAPERKTCGRCGQEKGRAEFSVSRTRRDGLATRCNACEAIDRRRRKYDLAPERYAAMLAEQGGACAICAADGPLVVDHCHRGGQVRQLLCAPCNQGLGHFGDDIERMLAAVEYLRNHA